MASSRPALTPAEAWRKHDAMELRLTASLSERMLDLAELAPGMRVLDLATGRGEPAVPAARRVRPGGSVVGIDLSAPVLALAGERAAAEGITNLELRAGDAATLDDLASASFDAATVRWGLMYMADPVRALTTVRRVLRPGAPLVAALWAEAGRVPWLDLPRRVLARHADLPPVDRDAPGPCRYGDVARFERDLAAAGLVVDHVEEIDVPIFEAATGAELVAWVRDIGFARPIAGNPEAEQLARERDLAAEAEQAREGAMIRLGGLTRLVRARPTS
ncbi:MAG: 2-heptaprenyl,4-naphthoquinone methyltransferase [Labilithrix sp.]|nr:2-heptaprenyl,4-naphthoquinone methyltransferase [Labilithrix sp.]